MKTKTKKISAKRGKKKSEAEPLTLEALADYSQNVLLPAMDEHFATKTEFNDFRNSSLTNQDAMLKKLDILLTEKEVAGYQKEKERELWAIIIKSLKEHSILSSKELERISRLDVF